MSPSRNVTRLRDRLELLYAKYNRKENITSDPIQYVLQFSHPHDQEIAGLVAASLAYGNVVSIHRSIQVVLSRMEARPRLFLENTSAKEISRAMSGFRHRWTDERAITSLLTGAQRVIKMYGGLGAAFAALDQPGPDLAPALSRWVELLQPESSPAGKSLLARPERKSACKRLHLYLRWMVRKDAIDPGGWENLGAHRLLMPVDTHVYRFSQQEQLTHRKSVDARTVLEITRAFRNICPEDPVKYDFAISRLGIMERWAGN